MRQEITVIEKEKKKERTQKTISAMADDSPAAMSVMNLSSQGHRLEEYQSNSIQQAATEGAAEAVSVYNEVVAKAEQNRSNAMSDDEDNSTDSSLEPDGATAAVAEQNHPLVPAQKEKAKSMLSLQFSIGTVHTESNDAVRGNVIEHGKSHLNSLKAIQT